MAKCHVILLYHLPAPFHSQVCSLWIYYPSTLTQLPQFSSQLWKALQCTDPGSVFSGLWYSLRLLEHLKLGAITVLLKSFQNKILEQTTSSYYFQNRLRESKNNPIIPIQTIRWWWQWELLCARHSCKESRCIDHLTSAVLWRVLSYPLPITEEETGLERRGMLTERLQTSLRTQAKHRQSGYRE